MKAIIAKSVLLPFIVAATIPVVTYASEVITPKKMSVPQVSTPHPTTPQGNPPPTGQQNLFHRYQLGTVEVVNIDRDRPVAPTDGLVVASDQTRHRAY
jgi:hypothetical protein